MQPITYDNKSLLIDGKRIQLISGAFHYFRVPRSEWRDRLLKCKQAGLNTIETIVPWNIHEYREGTFHFAGNRDLSEFLYMCKELEFYTILRPSPYICGEWDHGGIPAWLTVKSHVAFRRSNPVFLAYTEKWYDVLMPILAKHQFSQGGSIILVQIENEYGYFQDAQELSYMESLRDMITARGIEVPLVTCDWPGKGFIVEGAVKCANFGSDFRKGLAVLREEQPDAFAFVSELWLAWFDHWGGTHQTRSGKSVANALKEVLAAGGHYNFYMWSGGTNFGYFAGRTTTGDYGAFITTSYDYDAPIGETGNITEKFFECRLVNWLANSMTELFAASSEVESTWVASNPQVTVTCRTSPRGNVIYLHNSGDVETRTLLKDKTTGQNFHDEFEWQLQAKDTVVLLENCQLTESVTLVRCTGEVLCMTRGSKNSLVVYGDAHTPFHLTLHVAGDIVTFDGEFPDGQTARIDHAGDLEIVYVNRQTAYVTLIHENADGQSWEISPSFGARHSRGRLPELSWHGQLDPIAQLGERNPLVAPSLVPLASLDVMQGYAWYRTTFLHEGGETQLAFTDVHDRAHVFVNGEYQGTVGSFAAFGTVSIRTRAGSNELTILLDALGGYTFTSRLGEWKGLLGGVYIGSRPVDMEPWQPVTTGADEALRWTTSIPWEPGTGARIRIAGLTNQAVTIGIDQHVLHQQRTIGDDDEFVELDVTQYLRPEGNSLWLSATEPVAAMPRVIGIRYALTGELGGQWEIWPGVVGEDSEVDIDSSLFANQPWDSMTPSHSGGIRPKLFSGEFALSPSGDALPLKLSMTGMSKGVVWLNGHHLGRFWEVGPQSALYIPNEWLQENNTLVVFDEEGRTPERLTLIESEVFV